MTVRHEWRATAYPSAPGSPPTQIHETFADGEASRGFVDRAVALAEQTLPAGMVLEADYELGPSSDLTLEDLRSFRFAGCAGVALDESRGRWLRAYWDALSTASDARAAGPLTLFRGRSVWDASSRGEIQVRPQSVSDAECEREWRETNVTSSGEAVNGMRSGEPALALLNRLHAAFWSIGCAPAHFSVAPPLYVLPALAFTAHPDARGLAMDATSAPPSSLKPAARQALELLCLGVVAFAGEAGRAFIRVHAGDGSNPGDLEVWNVGLPSLSRLLSESETDRRTGAPQRRRT